MKTLYYVSEILIAWWRHCVMKVLCDEGINYVVKILSS